MSTFAERWREAIARNSSHLCVGLDPDPARIAGGDVLRWASTIIDATRDLVCAYKPNIAFYEALGADGHATLRRVVEAVPGDIPVLVDAKRGDIDSTAAAYARSLFDVIGAHAVTVSPYLGRDSLAPFLARAERGVFILARTSNPGARDLQDLEVDDGAGGREPLYMAVARRARGWNENGNAGLVAGATYPEELARIRAACPELPLLVPGIGAQAGDLAAAARAASGPGEFLMNASRKVTYPPEGHDLATWARATALELRDAIEAALGPARAAQR